MERPEFEEKKEMVAQFQATDLKQISTYVKGLRRTEIIQNLGEIIVSEGQLDAKFVRDYIRDYLDAQGRSYDHLEADTEKDDTTGFHSNPDKIVEEQATGGHSSRQSMGDEELSYASLKGLEPLVTWVKGKGKLFTPAAREYGFTRFPRGLLLTGVPGCGKSMTAKVIAKEWGMNFHRISPEDIRGKYHGEDEHNLREILNQLVKNAPSLCFVDEAEKLFKSVDKGGKAPQLPLIQQRACFFNSLKTTENQCFSSSPVTTYKKCPPPSSTALTDASSSTYLTPLATGNHRTRPQRIKKR